MVKVAAVQEPSVYFDLEGCLARACEIIERAASEGVELVVFPEAWVPGYPDFVWGLPPANGASVVDQLYSRLFANAVDLSADGLAPVCEAARDHGVARPGLP